MSSTCTVECFFEAPGVPVLDDGLLPGREDERIERLESLCLSPCLGV